MENNFSNGETISQQQFTEVITSEKSLDEILLFTMAYDLPMKPGNAEMVHYKLLELADEGTQVTVGIDNTYANRVAPKSDLPLCIANRIGEREFLEAKDAAYAQLEEHPNVNVVYHGQEEAGWFPFWHIDHRKILLMKEAAVLYGFNINYQMDKGIIDSGTYISDPEAIAWMHEQSKMPHIIGPTREEIGDLTFVTRELGEGGNDLINYEVLETINAAKDSVMFCGQWLPDGFVYEALVEAAKRGVRVDVFANFPPISRQPVYSLMRYAAAKRLGSAARDLPNFCFHVPSNSDIFFHIKALVTDINDPENSAALTGNDNMTNQMLQRLGLKDISVRLNNYKHRTGLYDYILKRVVANSRQFDFSRLSINNYLRASARGACL